MCRQSRTFSTLVEFNSFTELLRPCNKLHVTAFLMMILLAANITCNPVPCKNIRSEPFAGYVSNPCLAREPGSLTDYTEDDMVQLRRYILNNTLPSLTNSYKRLAEEVLTENVDAVCRNGADSNLSSVPTISSLQGKEEHEALLDIYSSFLIHIGSVHHSYEQDKKYSDSSCQDNRPNHLTFSDRIQTVGSGLIEIACEVNTVLLTYSAVDESVLSGLSESALDTIVCDNHLCSRRILNDCNTIKSTSALLHTFTSYLQTL